MYKILLIFVSSLFFVFTAQQVEARVLRLLNGAQIEVANSHTATENGDLEMMKIERENLIKSIRLTATSLPYKTTDSIPDARELGYGDCKSASVAFRNILLAKGFLEDSLLLALTITEKGDSHAVLIIRLAKDGKPVTYVFDVRADIETIEQSIKAGYKYYSIEATPQGRLIGWNGKKYT